MKDHNAATGAANMHGTEKFFKARMHETHFTGRFFDEKPLSFGIDGKNFTGCGCGIGIWTGLEAGCALGLAMVESFGFSPVVVRRVREGRPPRGPSPSATRGRPAVVCWWLLILCSV